MIRMESVEKETKKNSIKRYGELVFEKREKREGFVLQVQVVKCFF
jgi:hypothetical protein